MKSMNSSPGQSPGAKLELVPESTTESMNTEIMKVQSHLNILLKNPDGNTDLIHDLTNKLRSLQDARDAKYAVSKKNQPNQSSAWSDASNIEGDPDKRGAAMR